MRRTLTANVCLLIVSLSGLATAWETWYVDTSVPMPGDGTSWAKAFNRIQHGIDAARNGDVVMVAQGEYHENIRFKGKNISLTGMDRPNTAISGDSAGPAVTFLGTEDKTCSLSEFTIRSGLAPNGGGILGNGCRARIQNNDITSNVAEECGGGLYACHGLIQGNTIMSNEAKLNGGGLHDCDGMIYNNTVFWNTAEGYRDRFEVPPHGRGGGLHGCDGTIQGNTIRANEALYGGGVSECCATIQYNTVVSNRAVEVVIPNSAAFGGGGGGLYLCGAIIRYNAIQANTAEFDGGGLANCDGIIQENAITGNVADIQGGALAACDGLIQGNIIKENFAGFCGGLIGCKGKIQNNSIITNFSNTSAGGLGFCDALIRGNLILGNTASGGQGGGLFRCHEHISCNTIVGNWADEGGGIYWCEGTVRNNIVWGNDANVGRQIHYQTNPTYCCIEGWAAGGVGNIISAPVFVDHDGPDNDPSTFQDNDYRLGSRSPCIDQGYNEPWMWGAVDLDGNNRVFNGGVSATVDMGAYEFGSRVFQIVDVKRTTRGAIELTWDGNSGESYAVWSRFSLPSGGVVGFWIKEATVSSQGSSTQWSHTSATGESKFYRVELQ